jgi:hypothetical protein
LGASDTATLAISGGAVLDIKGAVQLAVSSTVTNTSGTINVYDDTVVDISDNIITAAIAIALTTYSDVSHPAVEAYFILNKSQFDTIFTPASLSAGKISVVRTETPTGPGGSYAQLTGSLWWYDTTGLGGGSVS